MPGGCALPAVPSSFSFSAGSAGGKKRRWVGRARFSLHFPRSRRSANRHARIPRESRAFGWPSWQDISSLDLDRSARTERPTPRGERTVSIVFPWPRRALSARPHTKARPLVFRNRLFVNCKLNKNGSGKDTEYI